MAKPGEWLDLSHPLAPGMPVYPGDPAVTFRTALTREDDGAAVGEWTLGSHAGTHVDAPSHTVGGGRTMSEVAPGELCGPARVLAFEPGAAALSAATLEGDLPAGLPRIVLLASGRDALFGTRWYGEWPPVDPAFAAQLWERGMRVLGVDTFSPDPPSSFDVHSLVLGRDGLIVENLRGLRALPGLVDVVMLPLPLAGADGAPVRAVARPAAAGAV